MDKSLSKSFNLTSKRICHTKNITKNNYFRKIVLDIIFTNCRFLIDLQRMSYLLEDQLWVVIDRYCKAHDRQMIVVIVVCLAKTKIQIHHLDDILEIQYDLINKHFL